MKFKIRQSVLFIMIVLMFSGCVSVKKKAPPVEEKPVEFSEPGNRYFYFIESELEKKKGKPDMAIARLKKAIELDPESSYLQRELATLYFRKEENTNALRVVEDVLLKNPKDIEALILYAGIKQRLDCMDDAIEAYQKIIDIDPDREDTYLFLGGLYLKQGQGEKAFDVYDRMVQRFPHSYVGHFYLGKIHADQGRVIEAEKEFQKTLELEPDLEEPRYELIDLYKKLKKPENIPGIYEDILERDPDNIRAAIELGYFYYQDGRKNDAEEIFSDLGTRSLTDSEVIREIVQLYIDPKEYHAAAVVLEGMLKGAPESSDIHYIAGIAYDGIDDKQMAIMHLKKVIPDSRFYKNAVIHVSHLYQQQGNIEEAIQFLNYAIKNVTDDQDLLIFLGSFYEEIKEYEKALTVFRQALGINPDNSELYFRMGVVHDKRGDKEASIEAMKTVIRLDPQNANALNYLGYTYADLGQNLDEAERLIKEALRHKPDDGYIIDSLGWVYFKKGLYEKALEFLEKAARLVPDDPIILEHLGDAFQKTNDRENALKYYKRALQEKTDNQTDLEKKILELKPEEKKPHP